MPLYKYRCEECGEVFEELVIGLQDRVPCAKCQSEKVSKMVSLISAKGIATGCTTCEPSKCSSKFT